MRGPVEGGIDRLRGKNAGVEVAGFVVNIAAWQTELRTIFIENMWDRTLRGVVKRTFERATADLKGQPITLVFLSGGSANIG
jgi:hypothetical protein